MTSPSPRSRRSRGVHADDRLAGFHLKRLLNGAKGARCVAALNIAPFRLPTLTPAHCSNSKWIQVLTTYQAGSMLGADRRSKAAPIHSRGLDDEPARGWIISHKLCKGCRTPLCCAVLRPHVARLGALQETRGLRHGATSDTFARLCIGRLP